MQESRNKNRLSSIAIEKLVGHPDNPNRMSRDKFNRLLRNIERTGLYEPIIVRPQTQDHRQKTDFYQIINGHSRVRALRQLGHKTADCIVWDVDDEETDILLLTLNRLGGRDVLDKKIGLLRRSNKRRSFHELSRILPQTAGQIERLVGLKPPAPADCGTGRFLYPMTFFTTDRQQEIIRRALAQAHCEQKGKTGAEINAAALAKIAEQFIVSEKHLKF